MIPTIQAQAQLMIDTFHVEEAGIKQLIAANGPVMSDLTARALRVQAAAKQFATGEGGGPHVRTGLLRGSITWRIGADAVSPYVDIGTSVHYAPYVEFGHKNSAHAYPIYTPGGKFTGRFGYVSDKPTPPYPFLRPAAEAARTT